MTRLRVLAGSAFVGGSVWTFADKETRDDILFPFRSVARGIRVVSTVTSISADYKWTFFKLRNVTDTEERRLTINDAHLRSSRKLLWMCRENGGVYIKLGQHVSALTYLVPEQYCTTLAELQDMCPQSSMEDIQTLFRREMGCELADQFTSFESEPVGSASLAQVHRAILKDGTEVAVKLQHLPVKRFSEMDIAVTDKLVHAVKRVFPDFEFVWLAEEMKMNLPRELDFRVEAENAAKLKSIYAQDPVLEVPLTRWVSKRIHCMEFVRGARVDDVQYLKQHNINSRSVACELSRIFSKMIFQVGFVHVDPHPGNLLIQAAPGSKLGFKIILLDHGLYREYDDEFRLDYARMWAALMTADIDGIKKYSTKLGGGNAYQLFSAILTARSWDTVHQQQLTLERSQSEKDAFQEHASGLIVEITKLLASIPRPLLLLLKTNDLLRNLSHTLGGEMETYIAQFRACRRAIYEDAVIDDCLEDEYIATCAFNPRGTLLATGCSDGRLLIWNFETHGVVRELWGHIRRIFSVDWSHNGLYVISAAYDTSSIIWDVPNCRRKKTLLFESPVVLALFNPQDADVVLVSPANSAPIQINITDNSEMRQLLPVPNAEKESSAKSAVMMAIYDRAGEHIFVGTPSGKIHVFDSVTLELISTCDIVNSTIQDMILSPDNKSLLVNAKDRILRTISISDVRNMTSEHKFQDLVNRVQWTCCTFSPDCEYIVAGCTSNHNLYLWERSGGSLVKILEGPREPSYALAWHPTRPIVASVSSYGLVYLWSKNHEENWSSFAPGFKEYETNVEYDEREDEFDRVPDAEISERKRITEDVEVDIFPDDSLVVIEELSLRRADLM